MVVPVGVSNAVGAGSSLRYSIRKVTASDELKERAAMPAADKELLATYGKAQRDKDVPSALLYLKDHGLAVKQAAVLEAAPKQWQRLVWLAVAGQILLVPFIFVLAGPWSPRRARLQAEEHDAWLQSELAQVRAAKAPQLV